VRRPPFPVMLPLLAMLFVVVWGGGLGAIFIFLGKTDLGVWGAVIVGMALVVGVPSMAALLTLPKR